jgi:energy-coupling factor transporter ATP-binding protein EcfA2
MTLHPTSPLHLTRLRVEQFRQFRQPFELPDLQPGLNLFTGPNEAGKSTLVRAIRAAFFERHRSSTVDDLRPWNEPAAAPTVELEFVLDGVPARLVKTFLKNKRCSLQLGAQQLEGVDAEDRLADIFGFAFAGKGASKAEHWGIPGLLWIEQGTGQNLHGPAEHAREHLYDALQGLVHGREAEQGAAALAATDGDVLLARFSRERDVLLTGTGRPRGELLAAKELADTQTARLAELDTQIQTYRQQVDQLAAERAAQQQDVRDRPEDTLRRQLQQAEADRDRLATIKRGLSEDQARLQGLEGQQQLLDQQQTDAVQQEGAVLRRRAAQQEAAQQLERAEAALQPARQLADAARLQLAEAEARGQHARLRARHREARTQRDTAARQAAQQGEQLAEAEAARQRLTALQQQAAGCATTADQVAQLRTLARSRDDARLQRDVAATRLGFTLEPGQSVEQLGADGQTLGWLDGSGVRWLLAPTALRVPGVGTFHIQPGGETLADRERAHAAAQQALQQQLDTLGLPDLAAAESRLAQHQAVQTELRLAEQALKLRAPKGVDALRLALAQTEAALAQAEARLAALPALPWADDGAATLPTLAEAEQAVQAAQALDRQQQAALAQAAQQHTLARSELDAATRELAAAEAALHDPARQQRLHEAGVQRQRLSLETAELRARVAQTDQTLRDARPDTVAQDIDRLGRSLQQLAQAQQQREIRIAALDSALQQAGAQGLEETRATLAGELQRTQRRHVELNRRAAALDWLCRRLAAQRRETLAHLQAPLQQHLQHYLHLLFPHATLALSEQLLPTALSRPGLPVGDSGEFEALSFGAREQLGLIVRFAYADLLREAGRPTLLILDDALVHSDAGRLAQMKRVLFDVAQRHQVLLFTCHPALWRDLGVPARALEHLRGAAA